MPNKDDDVYTEAIPLARKVPVVDYQIIELNNKPYYKIIRADDTHQLYVSFLTLLRNFDREDLEALWGLVKERFFTTKPKNFSNDFLLVKLGAMFEKPDIHAQIWKNQRSVHGPAKVKGWKLLESCGVQIITFTTTQLILLVERKYPLTRFTLGQMLNAVRLEVDKESEVSLELLRFTRQQHQEAKRRKLDEEVEELKRHLQIMPNKDDDVYTEAIPLARKVPVVDYQIIELNNKPYYKIIRADDTHQLYVSFLTLLRNFDREDLEALWGLVKERFFTTKPKNFSNDFLLVKLGAMFEKPDIHAQIWKNQRSVHGPA
nr:hypothetical protein [Tanacetum cinerariifolium]